MFYNYISIRLHTLKMNIKLGIFLLVGLLGACVDADSCSNRCDTFDLNNYDCQCNDQCSYYGNCCSDYVYLCSTSAGSCSGRCGAGTDPNASCQCNSYCIQYADCCSDYDQQCGSGAPVSVTDTEIKDAALAMWDLDIDSAVYTDDVVFNLQSSTTTGATNDAAPSPFFTYVNQEVLNRPTFQKLEALQDNYIRNQGNTEVVTNEELAENSDFLDAVLATAVGQKLYEFLDSKNLAGSNGLDGFKEILNTIWFGMYSRQATADTSGFEHSFVGEIKGSGVSGFHNWVKFYREELAGNFNYQGYLAVQDPNMIGMRHTWYGFPKTRNGFTVGFSPELEFGLYSLCYLTKPGEICAIKLRDESDAEVTREIQTWTWTNEIPPNDLPLYIASAYFLT